MNMSNETYAVEKTLEKRYPGSRVRYHVETQDYQIILHDGESFRAWDAMALAQQVDTYLWEKKKAEPAENLDADKGLVLFYALLDKAKERAVKAAEKFPQPNYVLNKFSEESGEVVKEIIHYTENRGQWARVEDEIVDLLAMTLRLLKEGDGVIGFVPPYLRPEIEDHE